MDLIIENVKIDKIVKTYTREWKVVAITLGMSESMPKG
jgi:hypothetical protein